MSENDHPKAIKIPTIGTVEAQSGCCASCNSAAMPLSEPDNQKTIEGLQPFIVSLSLAAIALGVLYLVTLPWLLQLTLASVLCLFLGWNLLKNALVNLFKSRVFDENLLMSLAVIGALVLGDFKEALLVLILFNIGEFFEEQAVKRSRRSIAALIDRRPRLVLVEANGQTHEQAPAQVRIGDVYLVRHGDQLALDGEVISGESELDTASLTGEALPQAVGPGSSVLSGCINLGEVLRIRVNACYNDSTLSRILRLVGEASAHKAKSETFIRRFARWYTPAVAVAALILALVPSLLFHWGDLATWVERALVFLVISCPCALVISVPLTYFAGIGAAAAAGVLVKGGNHLDSLGRLGTLAFDKTGTLTEGHLGVSAVHALDGVSNSEILAIAARSEALSSHPVARAVWRAGGSPQADTTARTTERKGRGIMVQGKDGLVHLGSARYLLDENIAMVQVTETDYLQLHVAIDRKHVGYLELEDPVRPGVAELLDALKSLGIRRTVLLSGDLPRHAQRVAQAIGIAEAHGGLLPSDKVRQCELLCEQRIPGRTVGFVGDGINDAPVLARADLGIAMGGIGSDAAIEAADVVLMAGNLSRLPHGIRQARKTARVARQNILLALGIKVIFLGLGAFGIIGIALAVFADTGTTVLAVLNSLRARRS